MPGRGKEPGYKGANNVPDLPITNIEIPALARELLAAYVSGGTIAAPLSARDDLDLNAAYSIEAEFARLRIESGRTTTGLKVGYANKAMWRALKLRTLVWAHMYDDTVHHATGTHAELALPYYRSPKIEPEIVFKMKQPIAFVGPDAAAVLQHIDWIAIGFEIIDCPFPDWQFKPSDFVAAFGFTDGQACQHLLLHSQKDLGQVDLRAVGFAGQGVTVFRVARRE
jgi:2-keto-4-pentenoate hydratase